MPQYCLVQHDGKAKDLVFNLPCTFILATALAVIFLINLIQSNFFQISSYLVNYIYIIQYT